MEVYGLLHVPRQKPPVHTEQEARGEGSRAGLDGFGELKSLVSPPDFKPRTVQTVA